MTIEFQPIEVPGARTYYGNALPYGLHAKSSTGEVPPLAESVAAIREFSASGKLQELLDRHGAVLIRGFGRPSAETFSALVAAAEEARGFHPFEQIGLAGKRTAKAEHVWTANEGSSAKRFYQHNEVRQPSDRKWIWRLIESIVCPIHSLSIYHSFLLCEEGT